MTIGQLAKRVQLNVQTIRFYERKGLVAPIGRTDSGYRRYTPEAVNRIHFVKHAKAIGFSLREIEELLSLRVAPGRSCADVEARAETKMLEVEERIRSLKQMREALAKLVAQCSGEGPVSECPIIEALDAVNGFRVEE